MDLSIIIVNYNSSDLLKKQLDYFANFRINLNYEILVIDNGSSDNSINIGKNYNFIKLISSKNNVGYFGGVNIALKEAKGDYILVLNTDIIPHENSIEKLYDFLKNHNNIGLVGPKLLHPNGDIQSSCFRFYNLLTPFLRRTKLGSTEIGRRELYKVLMEDFEHDEIIETDWILGAAFMISKKTIEYIGGLDERYFLYYEDMDLCKTCWLNKKKVVYLPTAVMTHDHQRMSANIKGILSIIKNKVLFIHIKSAIKYTFKFMLR